MAGTTSKASAKTSEPVVLVPTIAGFTGITDKQISFLNEVLEDLGITVQQAADLFPKVKSDQGWLLLQEVLSYRRNLKAIALRGEPVMESDVSYVDRCMSAATKVGNLPLANACQALTARFDLDGEGFRRSLYAMEDRFRALKIELPVRIEEKPTPGESTSTTGETPLSATTATGSPEEAY